MRRYKVRSRRQMAVDDYAYLSGLREWNASFKACFGVAALFTVIAADSVLVSVMTILFMGLVTCLGGKLSVREYVRLLVIPIWFIAMSGIVILIQFGSGTDGIAGIPFFTSHLYITEKSLFQAVSLSVNALGAVSCLFLLTLSTPLGEIISVLKRIHVPGIILELMHFIYRYIFILLEINNKQKNAVRSRLGYCDKKTAIRSFGCEMANLLVLSMHKAKSYYDALESRGGDGNYLFWEEKRRLTWKPVFVAAIYFLQVILLLKCF